MRKNILFVAVLLASSTAAAQDEQADRVLSKYLKIRPSEREMAMYQLDWADSLGDAQKRAAREDRPIVLIIIHAKYGDIHSGHC
jgi:hypothetical protein